MTALISSRAAGTRPSHGFATARLVLLTPYILPISYAWLR